MNGSAQRHLTGLRGARRVCSHWLWNSAILLWTRRRTQVCRIRHSASNVGMSKKVPHDLTVHLFFVESMFLRTLVLLPELLPERTN